MICPTVVCCRMTPMQKAEVVEIVREVTHDVILAVGDGANDVAMIQVFFMSMQNNRNCANKF